MSARELEANVTIGDFRIERRIGAGGMGIVYEARQLSLDRRVALKVLGGALTDESAIARFRRAAQAAARLKHPGIAQIHFIGQDQDLCYMAMELIEGVPLDRVIARLARTEDPTADLDGTVGRLPHDEGGRSFRFDAPVETVDDLGPKPQEQAERVLLSAEARELVQSRGHVRRCCELVIQAAEALDYAHRQGVVHRDIKPGNLMLDCQGGVHLIDFGIARFFEDSTVTNTGQLVGTPMYMSPEQVIGRAEVDKRTDIYSLGLVLIELLTLRPAFLAGNREELLRRIVTKPIPPAGRANKGVWRDLESVVHKAAAKDPDDRYQDAEAFASDLRNALAGKPVRAKPYRYGFDTREVAAMRPEWIVTIGAVFCGLAILNAVWSGIAVILMATIALAPTGKIDAGMVTNFVFLGSVMLLSCFVYAIGAGIISGRKWARTAGLVTLGLVGLGAVLTIAGFVVGKYDLRELWGMLLVALAVLAASAALTGRLLGRETRDWFTLCDRLRLEHKDAR
jgi:serine/threonine protein kinase